MPTKNRLLVTLLLVAACGDNDSADKSLTIEMPASGMELCTREDESTTSPGLQASVRVRAVGFRQGDTVNLDIVLPADATDPSPSMVTLNNEIVFTATLPEGSVVLQARAGDVLSETVGVTVNTSPPQLDFIEPTPGASPETIGMADDLDPGTAEIDFEVVVATDVEDGEALTLQATPPSGNGADLGPATVATGQATWQVPFGEPGLWTLEVSGMNACGNAGTQTVEVFVNTVPSNCQVAITPEPLDITGVGSVLNASLDPSADPDFQATIVVTTSAGASVVLFLDDVEVQTMTAASNGTATFNLDLPEGADREIRAVCTSGTVSNSLPEHVLVDITSPSCSIDDPTNGTTLTPADDLDDTGEPPDDIDFDIVVSVGGGDSEGEPLTVDVDGTDIAGTVTGGGETVRATLASGDASVPITLTAQDRARNTCTDMITIASDLAGCSIEITSPSSTVFTDADAGTAGAQLDVVVTADAACNGATVELSGCDAAGTLRSGVLAGGQTTIRTTFCTDAQCEQTRTCTATVSEPGSGIVTSDSATISMDTAPPTVTMSILNPPVVCGSSITAASDFDPIAPGVQVRVRLFSSPAPTRWFEVTPQTGPPATMFTADLSGYASVTITDGTNTIVAFAMDDSGTGMSGPCTLTLSSVGITITDPMNGQTLGAANGTPSGSDLIIQVCGTVTDASATVSVSVDGGTPVAATVTGMTWCASNVTVPSGGPHTITATGTTATGSGMHSITVFVDVIIPDPPTGLMLSQLDRRTVQVDFIEPADLGGPIDRCVIKSSTTAIDTTNFEALPGGRSVDGTGTGSMHTETFTSLRLGPVFARFWAVRCYDNANNPSTVVTMGPFELNFEAGPVLTPTAGFNGSFFGITATAADLDDDGIDDVIVSAPRLNRDGVTGLEGRVFIYMGAAGTGIASSPTYIIDTAATGASRLGNGLTRVDWNDDGIDDVAIGAPSVSSNVGAIYVFLGGDAGTSGMWAAAAGTTYTTAGAHATITFAAESTFDPTLGRFGWALSALDFDGDGQQDLVIGGPTYGGSRGGALVLFGGSAATSIIVPTNLADAGVNTKAYFFSFSSLGSQPQYGTFLANLGAVSGSSDSREDLGVAPSADAVNGGDPVTSEDRIFLFYGRAQPSGKFQELSGTVVAEEQIVGEIEADGLNSFGEQMGSLQDVNGDGRRELLVSARRWSTELGRVYLVPIGDSPGTQLVKSVSTAAIATFSGSTTGDVVGSGMANPATAKLKGDVDGDNIDDILIGSNSGMLVFYGAAALSGGFVFADAADFVARPSGFFSATTVIWSGDLDGNGMEDVFWGDADITLANPGAGQTLY